MHTEEGLGFSRVRNFNLDEYIGYNPVHSSSYSSFMWENLFSHINVDPSNVYIPRGDTPDPGELCHWYGDKIEQSGRIDIQLLGIGGDGHIGFNEPGSSLGSRTRKVALDPRTIEDNSRFFERQEDVPRFAIAMGVGTIVEADRILLIANGKKKDGLCTRFIEEPVTSQVTATALQLHKGRDGDPG